MNCYYKQLFLLLMIRKMMLNQNASFIAIAKVLTWHLEN